MGHKWVILNNCVILQRVSTLLIVLLTFDLSMYSYSTPGATGLQGYRATGLQGYWYKFYRVELKECNGITEA